MIKKLALITVKPYLHYMGHSGIYRLSKCMMTMRQITFFFKFFQAIFKLTRCKQVGYQITYVLLQVKPACVSARMNGFCLLAFLTL